MKNNKKQLRRKTNDKDLIDTELGIYAADNNKWGGRMCVLNASKLINEMKCRLVCEPGWTSVL